MIKRLNEDPRWQHALRLLRDAVAAHDRGDTGGMARAFESCLHTLDSLAVDPRIARDQRRRAARIVDKIDTLIEANLPALLRRLAVMRDTATDADARAEAAAMLAQATEQLPAASNTRH